jgi:uncharacterized membrane protein
LNNRKSAEKQSLNIEEEQQVVLIFFYFFWRQQGRITMATAKKYIRRLSTRQNKHDTVNNVELIMKIIISLGTFVFFVTHTHTGDTFLFFNVFKIKSILKL